MSDTNEIKDGMQAVDRNIAAVHRVRIAADENRQTDEKFIDSVAFFIGSTSSIYLHVGFYGIWLLCLVFGFGADTKTNLSLVATLEAIFLTVFVLVNQRRTGAVERKNSDLHLQMSLLVEHELTRLARTVDAIAKKTGAANLSNGLEDVKRDIHPDAILNRIAEHEEAAPTQLTDDGK